jgi:hypothetical protein
MDGAASERPTHLPLYSDGEDGRHGAPRWLAIHQASANRPMDCASESPDCYGEKTGPYSSQCNVPPPRVASRGDLRGAASRSENA